jgi:ABC-type sugar transport system substrate-binding protein
MARKFPNIHVIEDASAGWSQATAEKLVTEWIAKGDRIDAVLANNDSMALGAIDALDKAKLTKVLVGGVDGQAPATFAAMQKGKLTLTVRQNAAAQGAEAVLDALSLMDGKPVQQYDWVPFELVTQQVLPAYLPK